MIILPNYYPKFAQGRLTLVTATPVMTSTQSGKTTIYYTPADDGDLIALYNGQSWSPFQFTELSQATTDATKSPAAATAFTVYDMFVWDDAGTRRCTRGPKWSKTATVTMTIAAPGVVTWTSHGLYSGSTVSFTNSGGALPTGVVSGTDYFITVVDANSFKISSTLANQVAGTFITTSGSQSGTHTGENRTTSRGTGAGTSELSRQNGALVNTNAVTNGPAALCGRYVGSVYTDVNSAVNWVYGTVGAPPVAAWHHVYNHYNKSRVCGFWGDATNQWNYGSGAANIYQPTRAQSTARVEILKGGLVDEEPIFLDNQQTVTHGASARAVIGMGVDSITTTGAGCTSTIGNVSQVDTTITASLNSYLGIGLHYVTSLELCSLSVNSTFFGASGVSTNQSGLHYSVKM